MKQNFPDSQPSPNPTPQSYPCVLIPPGLAISHPQNPEEPAHTQQPQVSRCQIQPHPTSLTRPASVRVIMIARCPRHQHRYTWSHNASHPPPLYTDTAITAASAGPPSRQTLLVGARQEELPQGSWAGPDLLPRPHGPRAAVLRAHPPAPEMTSTRVRQKPA